MKHERLFKILSRLEDAIAILMIMIGSFLAIGESADLKTEIIVKFIGLALLTIGLISQKE
jgi:hypothetical protein